MKPLLAFDGDCGFCRRWINLWQRITKDAIEYAPYQQVSGLFPQIPVEKFEKSVVLIEGEKVSTGAEAVFRSLSYNPQKRWMLFFYEKLPGMKPLTEWFYNLVARNRVFFSKVTWLLWGSFEPSTYFFSSKIFLKLMGFVYLVAFASLAVQVKGLLGSNGVLPASHFLALILKRFGMKAYKFLPTIFWFNASDFFLQFVCWAGAFLSVLVMAEVFPALLLFFLWLFCLSLSLVGQEFLAFQWDSLLLEAGFLAIFLAPLKIKPKSFRSMEPSAVIIGLFNWLLFRLIFSSGMVKLISGDVTWRNLTALTFHYETQPLPVWTSWYMQQLPVWFQKGSTLFVFIIELVFPFLIFAPRRLRIMACAGIAALQFLIMATGNYCFFNLLALALCLLLLDDSFWRKEAPKKISSRKWPRFITWPLAAVILFVSTGQVIQLFGKTFEPAYIAETIIEPFRTVNHYGLFAVMTTSRPEIILEGSDDGQTWKVYEFPYKPGDLKKRPAFVQPYQPRLDWQMWFAALGDYKSNPWFMNLCARLLQGSPEVLALFKKNPFPDHPPKYLRGAVYDYHFTNFEERKKTREWWRAERKDLYSPTVSLKA